MAGNTTTKKEYNSVAAPRADHAQSAKGANRGVVGGKSAGQMRGNAQPERFSDPMNDGVNAAIHGLGGTHNDIGELSGFITDGYLDKQGTPYGEAAKFNYLPPGMDIGNQTNAEIHEMPLRKLVAESYPGDGWMPAPRDIPE